MQIGSYQFKVTLIPALAVLMVMTFLIKLGLWQLDRALEKVDILNEVELRKTTQPLSLAELDKKSEINHYHLKLNGKYDNQHYLFLDNRFYKSRVGFEVIQPFRVDGRIILVNRGWIPLPRDRNDLPQIPVIGESVEVSGEVHVSEAAFVLKEDSLSANQHWPKLVQNIDIKALTKLYKDIGFTIEPWILRQDADDDPFYSRLWITVNMIPERHISYAYTWFGLALALIIIYITAISSRTEKEIGRN